jgi:hypothetical protein
METVPLPNYDQRIRVFFRLFFGAQYYLLAAFL